MDPDSEYYSVLFAPIYSMCFAAITGPQMDKMLSNRP